VIFTCVHALQAVTTIRNLSANPSLDVKLVMDGVVPPLINLLRSPNPAVQEQAIVAVRNLSINPKNKVPSQCVCVYMHAYTQGAYVCVCIFFCVYISVFVTFSKLVETYKAQAYIRTYTHTHIYNRCVSSRKEV
jgi:hypothetical protein